MAKAKKMRLNMLTYYEFSLYYKKISFDPKKCKQLQKNGNYPINVQISSIIEFFRVRNDFFVN